MFGYVGDLRSKTQDAVYSMTFDSYAEVPKNVADEIGRYGTRAPGGLQPSGVRTGCTQIARWDLGPDGAPGCRPGPQFSKILTSTSRDLSPGRLACASRESRRRELPGVPGRTPVA